MITQINRESRKWNFKVQFLLPFFKKSYFKKSWNPITIERFEKVITDERGAKRRLNQEPLKLWTELYLELSPNGGLELVFLLLWYK